MERQPLTESVDSDPWIHEGMILDHRFRLERYLGAGSVHTVFAAQDLLQQQEVCVKIPRRHLRANSGFALRYRRDLLNVMTHSNPGWVTPLLVGEHDGEPFQVQPLVVGKPLHLWYQAAGRNHQALLEVLKQALFHLSQLHRQSGNIHGCLKPENVMVDEHGEVLLLDLVATGRLEDQFAEKARTGNPVYYSPEQLVGERAGPPSDLYSLGLVVYQTLASRHPFMGRSDSNSGGEHPERLLGSMLRQLHGRPPSASSYREDVPRWADRFLSRCLLPDPAERFETPDEALDWLRHHYRSSQPTGPEHRIPPPAGREQEMAFLLECLTDIVGEVPQGTLIRLHGDYGIGKTRCTEWLKDQARQHGVRVLDVRRSPESGLHLQSVANALLTSVPLDSDGSHHEFRDARPVVEYLIEAALEDPLLLLLDDIAHADETLVRLLEELHSVLADLPVLVVLSEDSAKFRSPVVREFMESLDHVLILAPLDRRGIANLIEERAWSPPSAALAQWVHSVSGGNALAAGLLVDWLLKAGRLKDEVTLDWATSPAVERPNLETLLQWKLQTVSAATVTLLETGAVLGDPFNLSTLHALTYRDPEDVDTAIGEAVKAGILEVGARAGATTYAWAHPLYRQTLWDRLPLRRRQRIHRLAAAFYSRGEPEPGKLAYHFLQSGDDRELFYWGIQAAEKARRLGRRGEANYWLHVLLGKVDSERWLGPDLQRARRDISHDQSEGWDLDLWSNWFRALAGRAEGPALSDQCLDPIYHTQVLLNAPLSWPNWAALVRPLCHQLRQSVPEQATVRARALALLGSEWSVRAGSGEPFPEETH